MTAVASAAVRHDADEGDTCRNRRWCDDIPGHDGGCSQQVGSRLVHRQNGDEVRVSVRVHEDHHERVVVEVQVDDALVHLDHQDTQWFASRLREALPKLKD